MVVMGLFIVSFFIAWVGALTAALSLVFIKHRAVKIALTVFGILLVLPFTAMVSLGAYSFISSHLAENRAKGALFLAIEDGRLDTVRKLVPSKYSPDYVNPSFDDKTPLIIAAQAHQPDIIRYLLECRASTGACDRSGSNALFYAAKGDDKIRAVQTVQLLLSGGAKVEATPPGADGAMHSAAENGNYDLVKLLLDNKADPNRHGIFGATPLHIACRNRDLKMVQLLLDHHADINSLNSDHDTPFSIVCGFFNYAETKKNLPGLIQLFNLTMRYNPDLNVTNSWGDNPLDNFRGAEYAEYENILKQKGAVHGRKFLVKQPAGSGK